MGHNTVQHISKVGLTIDKPSQLHVGLRLYSSLTYQYLKFCTFVINTYDFSEVEEHQVKKWIPR